MGAGAGSIVAVGEDGDIHSSVERLLQSESHLFGRMKIHVIDDDGSASFIDLGNDLLQKGVAFLVGACCE